MLLILLFIPFIISDNTKAEKSNIIIRFDDYGIWCSDTWVDIEEKLLDLHEEYHVKITFGVVPNSIYPVCYHPNSMKFYPPKLEEIQTRYNPHPLVKNSNRVNKLKESFQKGISEIGQHGYYHPKYYSNIKNGEFYGYDYDIQSYKISDGKRILDSLFSSNTTVFIPPHNTYDGLTLNLLQECGFKVVSAKDIDVNSPQDFKLGLKYVPFTTEYFEPIIAKIECNKGLTCGPAPADVLLLHHTSFTDSKGYLDTSKLKRYEYLLSLINKYEINNYHISEAADNIKLLSQNKTLRKHLYHKIYKLSPQYAYVVLAWNDTLIILYSLLVCIIIIFISFWGTYSIARKMSAVKCVKFSIYITSVFALLFLIYGFYVVYRLYNTDIEICYNSIFSSPLFLSLIGLSIWTGALKSFIKSPKLK